MTTPNRFAYTLIRLMTAGIWLSVGLHKVLNSGFHIKGIELHGMAFAATAIFAVVVILEIGGSILMLMNRYVWLVCLGWISFLIPASLLYHTGWIADFMAGNPVGTPPGFFPFMDMVGFFKNVSLIGGLLALIVLDPCKPAWLRRLLEK